MKITNKGSALLVVVVLTTVISLLLSFGMMAFQLQSYFISREYNGLRAMYHAEAGIYKTLWRLSGNEGYDQNWRPIDYPIVIDDETESVITVKEWGSFLKISSSASVSGVERTIEILAAQRQTSLFRSAVHIGGIKSPLVITGSAQIIGDVIMGEGGVQTGSARGLIYGGQQPVIGNINMVSEPFMPLLNSSLLDSAIANSKRFVTAYNSEALTILGDIEWHDSLTSIYSNYNEIYIDGNLSIVNSMTNNNVRIVGPIKIISTGKIIINSDIDILHEVQLIASDSILIRGKGRLENLLIYSSKSIVVSGGTNLSGQLMAEEGIQIADSTRIGYPSVLYVSGKRIGNQIVGDISLEDNSSIMGTIIYNHSTPGSELASENRSVIDKGIIKVSKGVTVSGGIYSSNYAQIEGIINGFIVVKQFYLYREPTQYINWLNDAVIERDKLDADFLVAPLFGFNPDYKVLRWKMIR